MRGYRGRASASVERDERGTIVTIDGADMSYNPPVLIENTGFVTNALGKPKQLHYLSRSGMLAVADCWNGYPVPTASLLYQSAHTAFAEHHGFALSPEVFWYA